MLLVFPGAVVKEMAVGSRVVARTASENDRVREVLSSLKVTANSTSKGLVVSVWLRVWRKYGTRDQHG